ncbi:regulator of G protein signaling domain-containing protein [Fusarium oxysporum Fo47]|uniref:regulator of G protein signaling domain-containing protein n=1 Tax=Fusarium oxysporum Fo47 TaxID=660027 RepID=UPI00286995E1|nr:regulator of G protein signaling domain-containing protein [Fusarium oxysporum Fo47]QKD62265.2 regulator of G protein signaling domain-domain-containing protein [Fusarium oxysporum Fo47]
MHQSSLHLLRMGDDGRPFDKDFKDIFSTLIVSLLPLSAHRVRLTKVEYTFLSQNAISNLMYLKFTQSNRLPDPKDSSRIINTTTAITFSMSKEVARSICQCFVDARLIESADATRLVLLERDLETDKLHYDQGTIEIVFRRLIGADSCNAMSSMAAADSSSILEYRDSITEVKPSADLKANGKIYNDTFPGKAIIDWLMNYTTIMEEREAVAVATRFMDYNLIDRVTKDRAYTFQNPAAGNNIFHFSKHAFYQLTQRSKRLINGSSSPRQSPEREHYTSYQRNSIFMDSNTQRLDKILTDPSVRLLFREQSRDTYCEENLTFYQDVDEFIRNSKAATRAARKELNMTTKAGIDDSIAQAYRIYHAFLASGSPCELNIDHQLRNSLTTRMSKAVSQDATIIDTVEEVIFLFEEAQEVVFKLMASVSVF